MNTAFPAGKNKVIGRKGESMEGQSERIIRELADLLDRRPSFRKRRIAACFLEGLFRGFGMAVGFTLLGAVVIALLRRLVSMNVPLIGGFLAEVIRIVLERL